MVRPLQIGVDAAGTTGLVVIDMQRDFMEGGPLPVAGAAQIVPVVNHYVDRFTVVGAPVILTRDWHPPEHRSFAAQGGRWPVHCVAGSPGAEFATGLSVPSTAVVVSKGTRPGLEGYSAFEDGALAALLRARGIAHLWLCGVATEHCVRATALDALDAGFTVTLLVDAIRGVETIPGDAAAAVEQIVARGARAHAWPRRRGARSATAATGSRTANPEEQRR